MLAAARHMHAHGHIEDVAVGATRAQRQCMPLGPGTHVRDAASVGGNLALARERRLESDLATVLMGAGASVRSLDLAGAAGAAPAEPAGKRVKCTIFSTCSPEREWLSLLIYRKCTHFMVRSPHCHMMSSAVHLTVRECIKPVALIPAADFQRPSFPCCFAPDPQSGGLLRPLRGVRPASGLARLIEAAPLAGRSLWSSSWRWGVPGCWWLGCPCQPSRPPLSSGPTRHAPFTF